MIFSRDILEQSYRKHPDFSASSSWHLENEKNLASFSHNYCLMRNLGYRLATGIRKSCFENCNETLNLIFSELRLQVNHKSEQYFLNELEQECCRLIREEAKYYFIEKKYNSFRSYDSSVQKNLLSLLKHRYFLGQLSSKSVQTILELGESHLTSFQNRAKQGRVKREDLSFSTGSIASRITSILNQEFQKLGVLDAVSIYMNQSMCAGGQAFELSLPQSDWWHNGFANIPRTPHTLYAHLDEGIAFPKAILYLTDVTPENGPTGYYPHIYEELDLHPIQEIIGRVIGNVGNRSDSPLHRIYRKSYHQSMTSEVFRHHFMRLPEQIRFNSHFGWDILPDSRAEKILNDREIKMLGAAGKFIVFDGARLLHRGGLIKSGERVALQIVFTKPPSWLYRVKGKLRSLLS